MRISEKLDVAKSIAAAIHDRYNFAQASVFINAFLPRAHTRHDDYNSVREMAEYNLSDAPESVLGEIVADLGIDSLATIANQAQPPSSWQDTTQFRVFLSHVSKDKDKATRTRDALKQFGVKAFVAHEDIEPTLEWQVQIERALHNMDAFISIHTVGFAASVYCQQEVGFALARGVKIIAIRMGEDPVGFISKHQALSRGEKRAEALAEEIDALFLADERTHHRYVAAKESLLINDAPF